MDIAFNKPRSATRELQYVAAALASRRLAGGGPFTARCNSLIEALTGCAKVVLTHSCTAALEMAAILIEVGPGDEVIMPSFTFVSTANAFVLRGATPVFVDVASDTLNLDERLLEGAITQRTKAIVPVHYAGVGCGMARVQALAREYRLAVVEDAAQGLCAFYREQALGTMGALGTLSFHETKNVLSGEGGALLVNDAALRERADIIREKGTDRSRFLRGELDKYTWIDIGSSYLPSELVAAVLCAQLEEAQEATASRLALWQRYHAALLCLEQEGRIRRPAVPQDCRHNAHIYYMLLPDATARCALADRLKRAGIGTASHYVPLHSSPAGRRFGRIAGARLPVTEAVAEQLIRLPLWPGLESEMARICGAVIDAVRATVQARSFVN
ncbi:MAG: dTDP-4-amino-4,6-dideoxygalactose transaminase [Burkholderiales bacterium]|nr:dTDP-4-amino-4,6-dideoxygalactose transaminase [Burkholderiales bacterium]